VYGHDDLGRALRAASHKGEEECAQVLIDAGALPNVHDASGFSPVIIAAKFGHPNIIRLLVKANCNINKANFRARATALHWAATNGHQECVEVKI